MTRARSTTLSAVSSILVTISLAAPASAVDPVTNSETLTAIEQVALAAAVVDPGPSGSGQLAADVGQGDSVTIPKDPSGAVALYDTTGQTSVRVGLPDTSSHKDAVVADDGTVTYADPTGKASIAVQALPNGVRILTVIAGPDSPTKFAYPITLPEGGSLAATDDGGFLVLDADAQILALIKAPWATDANGRPVPTRYEASGSTLVQVVDHRAKGIAYPVVADPSVSLGWKIYLKYNKSEVKNIAASPLTDKQKYIAAVCIFLVNPAAVAGCGFYVYDALDSVNNTFKAAASRNQCVELGFGYNGLLLSWKGYAC